MDAQSDVFIRKIRHMFTSAVSVPKGRGFFSPVKIKLDTRFASGYSFLGFQTHKQEGPKISAFTDSEIATGTKEKEFVRSASLERLKTKRPGSVMNLRGESWQ